MINFVPVSRMFSIDILTPHFLPQRQSLSLFMAHLSTYVTDVIPFQLCPGLTHQLVSFHYKSSVSPSPFFLSIYVLYFIIHIFLDFSHHVSLLFTAKIILHVSLSFIRLTFPFTLLLNRKLTSIPHSTKPVKQMTVKWANSRPSFSVYLAPLQGCIWPLQIVTKSPLKCLFFFPFHQTSCAMSPRAEAVVWKEPGSDPLVDLKEPGWEAGSNRDFSWWRRC